MRQTYIQNYLEKYAKVTVPLFGGFLLLTSFVFTGYDSYVRSKEKLFFLISSSKNRIAYLSRLGDEYEIKRILNDWVTTGFATSASIKFKRNSIILGQSIPHSFRVSSCDLEGDYELCVESPVTIVWAFPLFNFVFTFFTVFSLNVWTQKFLRRANEDARRVKNLSKANSDKRFGVFHFSDFKEISEAISSFIEQISEMQKKEFNEAKAVSQLKLASQVAHDIRSPLSALEMISSQLAELSEVKRIIIRNSINRIRDIANSLAAKKQNGFIVFGAEEKGENESREIRIENTLLLPLLDLIVTEKRIENRGKLNININFEQTKASYGLFSRININDFKRVLSNLVNNAIEALEESSGMVDISLSENDEHFVQIIIKDSGKGIPPELISKLGVRGNTFNKEGGSGLGLAHAKETLESFGGTLQISSKVGSGTSVLIQLPKENSPDWFVPKLTLKHVSKIIIFDDDQTIHQIWKGRFESIQNSDKRVSLVHFSDPTDLRRYFGQNFAELADALFLIDFEILNHKSTGLDLIEELGIHSQSILVTSRYEERLVRSRCEKLRIKLIPKSMSGFVPIETV